MTGDTNELMAELFQLIEQQIDTLRGELHAESVVTYGNRKKRIHELIERLALNGDHSG